MVRGDGVISVEVGCPRLTVVPHDFSTLRWCESEKHSVGTVLRSLGFGLFSSYAVRHSPVMLDSAGERSSQPAP